MEDLIDGAYSLAGPPAGVLSMAGCCPAFTPPAVCLRVTAVSVSRLTLRDPCYILPQHPWHPGATMERAETIDNLLERLLII